GAEGGAAPNAGANAGPTFTSKMTDAYERIMKRNREGATNPPGLDANEIKRRDAVLKELAQGRVTLVYSDLSSASSEEKHFVGFVMKAAELIEKLYAKQQGVADLVSKIPDNDPASKTLFYRAQGFRCDAPATHDDPACSAIPDPPPKTTKVSGMYPAS